MKFYCLPPKARKPVAPPYVLEAERKLHDLIGEDAFYQWYGQEVAHKGLSWKEVEQAANRRRAWEELKYDAQECQCNGVVTCGVCAARTPDPKAEIPF